MPVWGSSAQQRARLLLYLGAGAVAVGLAAGVLGLLLPQERAKEPASVSVAAIPPASGTTTLTTQGLVGGQLPTSTTRVSPDPSGVPTTSPAPAVGPTSAGATTSSSRALAEPAPPGGVAPSGDPASRLSQAASQAGYEVLRLEQEGWELSAVDLGFFDQQTYVDSVYRRGGDYLNLAQAPVLTQPSLPNATELGVRGQTAQLLDMGGGIVLVQWDENGSRVRVTSDAPREELLALLNKLQEVSAAP